MLYVANVPPHVGSCTSIQRKGACRDTVVGADSGCIQAINPGAFVVLCRT